MPTPRREWAGRSAERDSMRGARREPGRHARAAATVSSRSLSIRASESSRSGSSQVNSADGRSKTFLQRFPERLDRPVRASPAERVTREARSRGRRPARYARCSEAPRDLLGPRTLEQRKSLPAGRIGRVVLAEVPVRYTLLERTLRRFEKGEGDRHIERIPSGPGGRGRIPVRPGPPSRSSRTISAGRRLGLVP